MLAQADTVEPEGCCRVPHVLAVSLPHQTGCLGAGRAWYVPHSSPGTAGTQLGAVH